MQTQFTCVHVQGVSGAALHGVVFCCTYYVTSQYTCIIASRIP